MRKAILPIVFILATIGIFVGYISPAYQDVKTLRAEAAEYDQALDKAKELQSVRDALLSRYNTFAQRDVARLAKMLPDHVDNVRLILDIDGIASKYNMRTRNVVVTEEGGNGGGGNAVNVVGPDTRPYNSVVVSFSVAATYEDFKRFLTDLERSLRLVDLTSLSFSKRDGDLYQFDLSIRTYWLK